MYAASQRRIDEQAGRFDIGRTNSVLGSIPFRGGRESTKERRSIKVTDAMTCGKRRRASRNNGPRRMGGVSSLVKKKKTRREGTRARDRRVPLC